MSEVNTVETKKARKVHHTGRTSQVWIYLGKQFRFFINENDWKVLPMAAIIAGLVAMVIRKKFFVNMEGSLIGAFALACVASGTAVSIRSRRSAANGPSSSASTAPVCIFPPIWRPI